MVQLNKSNAKKRKDMEERAIDRLMFRRIRLGEIEFQAVDLAFTACLFVFSFLVRWKLMPIESADYWGFLEGWMGQIREKGGFLSLSEPISNYASPYMYLMCLVSYLTENDLYGLKMISVLFDYLGAFAVFLITCRVTGSTRKAVLGMAMLLLSPAVILDGAYWCQCDMIYTSFLLYALYFFLKDNGKMCLIFVGISFSFKLQAVFFLPFLVIMWLKGRTVKLRDFLWIPAVYFISALPAWLMGRDLKELMLIYFQQTNIYPWGTLEYPNIYALLGEAMPDIRHAGEVGGAGIFLTVILLGGIAYYFYTKRIRLTNSLMITLALFTVALTVYFLPHMHDRYGFFIDLLAILYGVMRGKRLPVVCGFMVISVLTFMPYLIAVHLVPITYLAIALLGLIICVGVDLHEQIQRASD